MKILVDLTYVGPYPTTGLANYAFNLLHGLDECGVRDSVLLLTEEGQAETFRERIAGFRNVEIRTGFLPFLPFTRRWLHNSALNDIIRREGIDLFLSPYIYDRSLTTRRVPSLGVIHDTYEFTKPQNPLIRWRFNYGAKKAANSFSRIEAISNTTRGEIMALGGISTPVEVIYDSIVSGADPRSRRRPEVPYILDVNTMSVQKNAITLLKAFNEIKDRIPHNLVFKGGNTPYWRETMLPYIEENGLADRVQLIDRRLSAAEMDTLMLNADLFVTPSEMEGFGMTPIEAAFAGVPVICNALPALLESTRGLMRYYSPSRDHEALAREMLQLLEHPEEADTEGIAAELKAEYSTRRQGERFIEKIEELTGKKF